MRLYAWLLLLVAVGVSGAYAAIWLAEDTGYVLVQWRGTAVETSLLVALVALVLAWAALSGLLWLLRWPVRTWAEAARRRGRERLARGQLALAEGRPRRAEQQLLRAARDPGLRSSALLGAARAAQESGSAPRALLLLERLAEQSDGAAAAAVLRAEVLLADGKAALAEAALQPLARNGKLPPSGRLVLIETLLARHAAAGALPELDALRRSKTMPAPAFAALTERVQAQALSEANHGDALHELWNGLSRAERRTPLLASAYARRADALGLALAAMSELEAALRKQWSEDLVELYGELRGADAALRLKQGESWLKEHADSAALNLALGRLCLRERLWGKAADYIKRALSLHESASAWEALADCHAAQGEADAAQAAYRNALNRARGDASQPLPELAGQSRPRLPAVIEQRDGHGLPRLPDGMAR